MKPGMSTKHHESPESFRLIVRRVLKESKEGLLEGFSYQNSIVEYNKLNEVADNLFAELLLAILRGVVA